MAIEGSKLLSFRQFTHEILSFYDDHYKKKKHKFMKPIRLQVCTYVTIIW